MEGNGHVQIFHTLRRYVHARAFALLRGPVGPADAEIGFSNRAPAGSEEVKHLRMRDTKKEEADGRGRKGRVPFSGTLRRVLLRVRVPVGLLEGPLFARVCSSFILPG